MKPRQLFSAGTLLCVCCLLVSRRAMALTPPVPLVRLAELEIDSAHLSEYEAALKEEIAASIRLEPGVLKLYAVAVKDHPTHIRLFEMYRDQSSYQAHLNTPHFKRYKQTTQHMIKSLTLIETEPLLLGAR